MIVVRPTIVEFEVQGHEYKELRDFILQNTTAFHLLEGDLYVSCLFRRILCPSKEEHSFIDAINKAIYQIDHDLENEASCISASFCAPCAMYANYVYSFIVFVEPEEERVFKQIRPDIRVDDLPGELRFPDPAPSLALLRSRPEAARLLLSALNSRNPVGKLIGFVRVMEAGFNLSHNKLRKPLHRFLWNFDLDYTRSESDAWIDTRHRVSHADRQERVLYDRDAYNSIPRVTQAAYLVALAKKIWRNPSPDILSSLPLILAFSKQKGIVLKQSTGKQYKLSGQKGDWFRRYPGLPLKHVHTRRKHLELSALLRGLASQLSLELCGVFGVFGYLERDKLSFSEQVMQLTFSVIPSMDVLLKEKK